MPVGSNMIQIMILVVIEVVFSIIIAQLKNRE
jgi:hypothetical protein